MIEYRGMTALVTGASSGLGIEFAEQLARRGANVILVARREDRLQSVASDLRARFGTQVTVLVHDLSEVGSGEALLTAIRELGLSVDVLVNNAGFATNAAVVDEDLHALQQEIQLNVGTLVELTAGVLPAMRANNRGVVLNVASTAAFQPVPNMAVYAATKAFVLSFTEALWGELAPTRIKALALCPGATISEFWDVAGMGTRSTSGFQSASDVVTVALRELDKDSSRPSVVSGRMNALTSKMVRFVPRKIVIKMAGKMFEPAS